MVVIGDVVLVVTAVTIASAIIGILNLLPYFIARRRAGPQT